MFVEVFGEFETAHKVVRRPDELAEMFGDLASPDGILYIETPRLKLIHMQIGKEPEGSLNLQARLRILSEEVTQWGLNLIYDNNQAVVGCYGFQEQIRLDPLVMERAITAVLRHGQLLVDFIYVEDDGSHTSLFSFVLPRNSIEILGTDALGEKVRHIWPHTN